MEEKNLPNQENAPAVANGLLELLSPDTVKILSEGEALIKITALKGKVGSIVNKSDTPLPIAERLISQARGQLMLFNNHESEKVRSLALETRNLYSEKLNTLRAQSEKTETPIDAPKENIDLDATIPHLEHEKVVAADVSTEDTVPQTEAVSANKIEKSKTLSDIEAVDSIMKIIDTSSPQDLVQMYSGLKTDLEKFTENERTSIVVESATRVLKHLEDVADTARKTLEKSTDVVMTEPKSTPILASIGSNVLDETAANEEKAGIAKLIGGQPKAEPEPLKEGSIVESLETVKTPGFMERMRKKIVQRKNKLFEEGTLLEKANKITKSSLEAVRGAGEWYNKQDPKVKLAVSLSLTAAVLGSAALSMGTTAVAFGVVAGAARLTASAGTFFILEKALKEAQIKKVGEENYTELKQKIHTVEAMVLATLLGGGVLGNAIENISSGRLAEALGFSSPKPPVDLNAPSTAPKTEQTETAPVIPKPEVAPSVVPTNEIPDYPATLVQEPGVSPLADPEVITAESNSATSVPVEGSKPGEPVVPATEPDTAKKPTTNLRAIEEEISPWKNESLPTSVSEYEVKPGDNMYKVIRANFPEINSLEEGRQANAIENILAKIREKPELYGIKDVNKLGVGDKINIEGIREIIDTTEIGSKSILETAKDLSPEIVKNIANYSPAQMGTPSSSIPTPTNSGVILDNTIIDTPYENPSVPEQPKTETQNTPGETILASASVEGLTKVPYVPGTIEVLPSGVPHPLEAHFESSPRDFTELSKEGSLLVSNAKELFNTEVNNLFGKVGFFSTTPGVESDLWKSVKDVPLNQLFSEKSKDESIEKLKAVLARLSSDTTHEPTPTGKETVEEFMKRTTLLLAEKGTKVT